METALLFGLILLNGLFAMSEVALLTARRPRLAALAKRGDTRAAAAMQLAEQPTRFLSTVQIGITSIGLLNGILGEAVFAGPLAIRIQGLGVEEGTSRIIATTLVVLLITYASIVIGELVPKRLGQHNAEGIARLVAWPMKGLAKLSAPFVQLLSVSTDGLLKPLLALFRIRSDSEGAQHLSMDEVRTLVLESSRFMPRKHVSILLNLFDLGDVTVQDIMVPRSRIESVTLEDPFEHVQRQLTTAYHMRLPVFRNHEGDLLGVIHLRRVLDPLRAGTLTKEAIAELAAEPYFVPGSTPVLRQLQFFQENRERAALVVDEYGELMGLVTVEDIIEEIVGKFTTTLPSTAPALAWEGDGSAMADGSMSVRDVNRALGLNLPTDGPKTLNGLVLEQLQDIPEAEVSVKIGGVPFEIVHAQGRSVRQIRIFRPSVRAEADHTSGF